MVTKIWEKPLLLTVIYVPFCHKLSAVISVIPIIFFDHASHCLILPSSIFKIKALKKEGKEYKIVFDNGEDKLQINKQGEYGWIR